MVEFASCEEPQVGDDSGSDDVVCGDDSGEDTGDAPVSIVEVTNAADVATAGFDDADGNGAAFEVWLDYDAPVAVTITGFAGTWNWQTFACE